MRVWEFAQNMRYTNLKDRVVVKKGGEELIKCRIEDLPHRENPNRHPKLVWVDEHIECVHMEAVHHPGTLAPDYVITIKVTTEKYLPTIGHVKGE